MIRCLPLACLALIVAAAGCQAPAGPDIVRIESGSYVEAFDAAVAAARSNGLLTDFRDRRGGIIETQPEFAPTLLEPWHVDGATLDRRSEHTLALYRRRARFEFFPAGSQDADSAASPPTTETLEGPDILALGSPSIDRSQYAGPMELRVWVFTERSHHPGIRLSTWTRKETTRTVILTGDPERPSLPKVFWTPVSRDRDFERRLLGQVQEALAPPVAGSKTPVS